MKKGKNTSMSSKICRKQLNLTALRHLYTYTFTFSQISSRTFWSHMDCIFRCVSDGIKPILANTFLSTVTYVFLINTDLDIKSIVSTVTS